MSAPAAAAAPDTNPQTKQPTRRSQELMLLVFAWVVGSVALANVAWGTGDGLPGEFWLALAVLGGAALIAHTAVRVLAPYAEPIMLPTAYLLNFLGLVDRKSVV